MNKPKINESEYRFCLILWENEPVTAAELSKICLDKLGWKRTTTYTVIKRLSDRGVVMNRDGTVTSVISKEEAQAGEIETFVESRFSGSIPEFLAAFTKQRKLSDGELSEIQKMIDDIRRGGLT